MPNWKRSNLDEKVDYNESGIYRIRLFRNGEFVEIPRLGGFDEKGMLVIGETKRINRRRRKFIRAAQKGEAPHSEGKQYWLMNQFSDLLEEDDLKFEYLELTSKKDAKKKEKEEIRKYFKKYLEVPPLNSNLPNRKDWIDRLVSK